MDVQRTELRVFKNKVLRKIYEASRGRKHEDARERKLHSEEVSGG